MENNSWLLQWGGNYTLYRRCFKLQSILNLSDRSSVHACSSTKRQGWRQLTECLGEVKISGPTLDTEKQNWWCSSTKSLGHWTNGHFGDMPQLILIDMISFLPFLDDGASSVLVESSVKMCLPAKHEIKNFSSQETSLNKMANRCLITSKVSTVQTVHWQNGSYQSQQVNKVLVFECWLLTHWA